MATEVIWFKRDLRLRDHPPLLQAIDSAALSGQSLLPLFFVEPERLKQPDTSEIHLHWELDCARALDRELQRRGSRCGSFMQILWRSFGISMKRSS